jgi:hypothetical protein
VRLDIGDGKLHLANFVTGPSMSRPGRLCVERNLDVAAVDVHSATKIVGKSVPVIVDIAQEVQTKRMSNRWCLRDTILPCC